MENKNHQDTNTPRNSQVAHHFKAPKNIVLVGLSGCGKTTIGRILSKNMKMGVLDIDEKIEEQSQKSIAQIFREEGEEFFRKKECELIGRLGAASNQIISVGAGSILENNSWMLLEEIGVLVWLDIPPLRIAKRLLEQPDELEKRPLLNVENLSLNSQDPSILLRKLTSSLEEQYQARQARYKASHVVFADSFSTPEQSAQTIRYLVDRFIRRKNKGPSDYGSRPRHQGRHYH